jgi:hypothetical protein
LIIVTPYYKKEWMFAKMDSFQEETKTNQAKTDTNQETLAEIKISQEEMLAKMEAKIGATQETRLSMRQMSI